MGKHSARRLISLVIAALAAVAQPAAAACSLDKVLVRGDFGQARFTVEVADTADERAQGLMNVPEMPTMAGMLFVYERPHQVAFWMHNTLIPLDMIFADETGTITRIHPNAIPLDRTPIDGGAQVQFVLEVNGGLAGRLGIAEGDVLQHPSIGENAALPCN
ncbi:hypothetical protein A9199_01085 [Donghicola sp. JL3646]|nr:hypothetical protein BSK21_07410 [Marivivens sp. JLT3646]NVJ96066.1 DUF192 domain-containing protein [Marivivens sp.]OBR39597.1 hypothetical protein A9199_01085 [Donghicola sp. JL3646]